ncbi:MAG: ligase-associated DNA damage response endonuclease PdeM [Pseudomonadota bacterium]
MHQLKPERYDPSAYASQTITLCGIGFVGDQSGALYWPAQRALIVSDLHFEKGSSGRGNGLLLPPYDTRETLLRLADAIDAYQPDCVICLGDSFHDSDGCARIGDEDLKVLRILQENRRWIWVTGNHDPNVDAYVVGGEVVHEIARGGFTLRHEPYPAPTTHEIAGHLHPAAKLNIHGASLRRRCFVSNGRRIVMPAFGAFTGGLNVLDVAFEPVFGCDGVSVWMLGDEGLYPVASRQLRGD